MTFHDYSAQVIAKMNAAAEAALIEVAMDAANAARKNVTGGVNATDKLSVRGGDLRSGIDYDITRRGLNSKARVGVGGVKYAAIHEFGGTIRAKKDWLTFQTRDGEWHRVKQVTIPARPYIRPAVMDRQRDCEQAFARQFRRRMGG